MFRERYNEAGEGEGGEVGGVVEGSFLNYKLFNIWIIHHYYQH